jgi:hypothetical protein
MLYEILFWVGALGVAAQSVLGFAHGHGGHGHSGEGGSGGGGHSHSHHAHHGPSNHGLGAGHHHAAGDGHPIAHGHHGEGHAEGHAEAKASFLESPLLGLLSPLTLFSLALGAGATGLLVRPYLSPLLAAFAATAGGLGFYGLIVRPMYRLILGFASKPATALEGVVAGEARAVSRFDSSGRGVVSVNVDGQIVRVLAQLEADDREKGVAVTPGETLVVTSVDGEKNVCKVTRL